MFLLVVLAVWASPAQAALQPGEHATIDVSVATLWKAPNLYRAIDRPSLTNPVDPVRWSDNLSTTASRVWLDSHVQTQALYAQQPIDLPTAQRKLGGGVPVSPLAHVRVRDPESHRIFGECFGSGSFLLEEDGCRLERWLEKSA